MMNVQAGGRVGGLAETASSDRAEFRTNRGHCGAAPCGPMSAPGVRRDKAALSSDPATAPAGSNRSSHGGNEVAEAFD